jgi:predicted small lipoprotein YifL
MSGGRIVSRAVLVGALVAGFALGGCGRKGALDPPPSASLTNPQSANMPPSLGEQPSPFVAPSSEAPPPAASATAGQQPAAKKTFILDWLLK